ncbi:hypothetical protein [Flavobacterium sp.]|uniref:hypothetical protein n=1 Tax=Flavobacterium sp. TaxID=239 RepID=UPI00374CC932
MLKKIGLIFVFSIPGIIVSYLLSFILENFLIPDCCDSEYNSPNWIIELLYDFPSWNGCHPYPSDIQFGLIYSLGIWIGYFIYRKIFN